MTSNFYIHIPFCRQKCPYCKFALTPVFDEFKKKRYMEYLKKEIGTYFSDSSCHVEAGDILLGENKQDFSTPISFRSKGQKPETVYFGGGTPSILSLGEAGDILNCFPERSSDCEITFECNPEDITTEYVRGLLDLGINRISLGVQSLNNETLSAIHRSNKTTIFSALDSIYHAITQTGKIGISLNVDFILGLPQVTRGETLENIKTLHRRYPYITHTSVYILEKGLYPKSWKNHTLEDDILQEEFLEILEYFESLGWDHYEFSNWAKPGYESRHNQSYWNNSDYRGFGLSAASYVAGERFSNSDSFSGYYAGKKIGQEVLTPEQLAIEELMFGLRTSRGFDITHTALVLNLVKICEFSSQGLIIHDGNMIKLTKTGIFIIDHIMGELIS